VTKMHFMVSRTMDAAWFMPFYAIALLLLTLLLLLLYRRTCSSFYDSYSSECIYIYDPSFIKLIIILPSTLASIERFVKREVKKNIIMRVITRKDSLQKIREFRGTLRYNLGLLGVNMVYVGEMALI
jgi:hypothetical protein